jgi:hypothetical protein
MGLACAGYATNSGSGRCLKVTIDGRDYFIAWKDILRLQRSPGLAVQVLCLEISQGASVPRGTVVVNNKREGA